MKPDRIDPLFKALADPTRRRVIELLRQGPATTGELVAHFPDLTRFAVMKHLAVLEEAGLVTTHKTGRERWNQLNPVPLDHVRDAWFGQKGSPMPVHKEVVVRAPRRRVYEALTRDLADWCELPELVADDETRDLVLDPVLGGHLKRLGVEGGQDLWAIVTGLHPGRRLEWQGSFGVRDAVVGRLEFLFDDEDGGTRLTFTAQHRAEVAEAWAEALRTGLVAYLER